MGLGGRGGWGEGWLGYVGGGSLGSLGLSPFTSVRLTVQNLMVGTVTPTGLDGA